MSQSKWREQFRPIIARILAENDGQNEAVIRKALSDAWRWGPRQNHPYQMWRKEIAVQRGLKTERTPGRRKQTPAPAPGQLSLAPLMSQTVYVLAKTDEDNDKSTPYWVR